MELSTIKIFERLEKGKAEYSKREKRSKHAEDLKTLDVNSLRQMDDKLLAEWQGDFDSDEPQWTLADQEWKRRAGIATRRIAIAAIIISGLSLLVSISAYLFPQKVKNGPSKTAPLEQPSLSQKLPAPPPQ